MTKLLAGAFLLLFSFAAAAQTPEDSVAFAGARWQITPLAAGAECRRAQIDMFDSRQTVSVVAYPARNFTTEIIQLDGKASPTSELGKAAGADAALNGSYFNMKTLAPVTFVLIDKQILGRTTPGETMRTNGVIALRDKRGRKMDILRCDTTQYSRIARRYRSGRRGPASDLRPAPSGNGGRCGSIGSCRSGECPFCGRVCRAKR